MPVTNLSDFQCEASFVINLVDNLDCIINWVADGDPGDGINAASYTASYDEPVPISKQFQFFRGTNTDGDFDYRVAYTVDGGTPTINTAPAGVSFSNARFDKAPDFTVPPLAVQIIKFEASFLVNGSAATPPFAGNDLDVTVHVGFVGIPVGGPAN